MPLKFIDLFSGCGGMSYGLEQAGLTCVLGIDNNKYAIDTFSKNHPNSTGFCGDIRKLNPHLNLESLHQPLSQKQSL